MAKKRVEYPFRALEQEAYLAYREWPILLVLRERELAAQLARVQVAKQKPPRRDTQKKDSK